MVENGVSLRIPRDPWADAVCVGEPLDVIRRALTVEVVAGAKIDRVAQIVRVGNHTISFDDWRRIARRL